MLRFWIIVSCVLFLQIGSSTFTRAQTQNATVEPLFSCEPVKFQCPNTYNFFWVPTRSSVWKAGSCELAQDVTKAMFTQCPAPNCRDWPSRINGCSVEIKDIPLPPKLLANVFFRDACNVHDLCYSSPTAGHFTSPDAHKEACDIGLRHNIQSFCAIPGFQQILRTECEEAALAAYGAVKTPPGQWAFDDDQAYVASSCGIQHHGYVANLGMVKSSAANCDLMPPGAYAWTLFGYDDKKRIAYCMQHISFKPTVGVTGFKGIVVGPVSRPEACTLHRDGWSHLGYTGEPSEIEFCQQIKELTEDQVYMTHIYIAPGPNCTSGGARVAYDSADDHNEISFCAFFSRPIQ